MSRRWLARPGSERWYVGSAFADGRSPTVVHDRAIHVRDGLVAAIVGVDEVPQDAADHAEIIDTSGSTAVPGLVDCHAHIPLQGGARWIERAADPTLALLETAEQTRDTLLESGVRWIRDVGSPVRDDVAEKTDRALSLTIRDRWRVRGDAPIALVAGGWLTAMNVLPGAIAVESASGAELHRAAMKQIDDGADLVKLYLDGPRGTRAPFAVEEIRAVVDAVHDRNAAVAAHATGLEAIQLGVSAGVDTVEHGTYLDEPTAELMARNGVALISTLSVYRSFLTFGSTTTIPRFADRQAQQSQYQAALASVGYAHRAGVAIGAGSDFGGGSVRPGHLAWEGEALVEAGLEPWQALGCLTWQGGTITGLNEAGQLRVDGPANILFVHGDPTADAGALWRVSSVVTSDVGADNPVRITGR